MKIYNIIIGVAIIVLLMTTITAVPKTNSIEVNGKYCGKVRATNSNNPLFPPIRVWYNIDNDCICKQGEKATIISATDGIIGYTCRRVTCTDCYRY